MSQDKGSFRDPSGHVFERNGRIFRTVNSVARDAYEQVRDSGALASLQKSGAVVESWEIADSECRNSTAAEYVLEHPRLPFVSYPYEWCFSQLRSAALHHLELQIFLLEHGVALSDASAYNVQFVGPKPMFIDLLSMRPYREGEFWQGHRQFCEQFLNPLLLRALCGVAHNAWYRGNLEGIPTSDIARLLPIRRKLSFNVFSHVLLQAKLQRDAIRRPAKAQALAQANRKLPKKSYLGLLLQLRRWIEHLRPADGLATTWGDYSTNTTYSDSETNAKRCFVGEFVAKTAPRSLIDLGCNTGDYSKIALENGAEHVVGFDFDQTALDLAFDRARREGLAFLPLCLDAANPSPDQGWSQDERKGFEQRAKADAVVALAFVHHLAIAKNIPLPQVVGWITAIAPTGVIEFVPKEDGTVQTMLALREDIFVNYNIATFKRALERQAKLVKSKTISKAGRTLFWYERS